MKVAFPGEIDSARLKGVVVDNLAAEIHGAWKESNYSTNFVDRNYLHDGDACALLRLVLENPGITPNDLAKRSRIDKTAVENYLNGMVQDGPVVIEKEGAGKGCHIDGAAKAAVTAAEAALTTATNDLNAVRMMIGPAVMYSASTILVFAVAIILMISIDTRLTLIALIPLPMVSVSVGCGWMVRPMSSMSAERSRK